jgi:RNA polymerase sigma-70 factor (ECF subfamily)
MQAQTEFPRELFFSELSGDLRKFIAHRIHNRADAEDVLQEALLKIHRSIGCFLSNRSLYAWVYTVTRNTIIDYYRKQSTTVSLDDAAILPGDLIREEFSRDVISEIAPCLRPMLDYLPEKYREAVRLADLEGWTQAEVAKHLGLSLSGAKSRVQRGREQLKALLIECCRFEFDGRGRIIEYQCRKTYNC